jgi:hypothetical protein
MQSGPVGGVGIELPPIRRRRCAGAGSQEDLTVEQGRARLRCSRGGLAGGARRRGAGVGTSEELAEEHGDLGHGASRRGRENQAQHPGGRLAGESRTWRWPPPARRCGDVCRLCGRFRPWGQWWRSIPAVGAMATGGVAAGGSGSSPEPARSVGL